MSGAWRRLAACAGLLSLGLTGPGCPIRDPRPRTRARPIPLREAFGVQLRWQAPPRASHQPVSPLPEFPRFRDPYPLPSRSLQKSRKLAYATHGERHQRVVAQLAGQLWQLANRELDRLRAIEDKARKAGLPTETKQVTRLKQQVSMHLKESVSLLEGVIESPRAPRMARVRLAHYLRTLKPRASARLFAWLRSHTKDEAKRRAYTLELVQLRLGLGEPRRAWKLLRAHPLRLKQPRAWLLLGLAAVEGGGSDKMIGIAVTGLLLTLARATPGLQRVALAHLPRLLAGAPRPESTLRVWAEHSKSTFQKHSRRVTSALLERLLDHLATKTAARLLAEAKKLHVPVEPKQRARLRALTAPGMTLDRPPRPKAWESAVRARLSSLSACRFAAGRWTLSARVLPSGRVSKVELSRTPRPRARPGTARAAPEAPPAELHRCVRRMLRRWQFHAWRARRYVTLRVQLTVKVYRRSRQ